MVARVILLLCLFACGASPARAEPGVTLTRLSPRLYVVEDACYAKENSLVYIGDDSITVIGATWTPETARQLAAEVGRISHLPIRDVINTNYHPDRAGGNAFWKAHGCSIHATKLTSELLAADGARVLAWTQRGIPNYPTLAPTFPTVTHDGDFALQGGRVKAIYLGPSHTPDGIFVYFPEEQVLYGGCILKEQLGNLDFADLEQYPKTLEKLKRLGLPIRIVIAGHGTAAHGPELIDRYLGLLRERKAPASETGARPRA